MALSEAASLIPRVNNEFLYFSSAKFVGENALFRVIFAIPSA